MADKKLIRFDWAMKYILRNKANFDVLEGFISILLKEEMKILEIIESESNPEAANRKFNRVDLKCRDSQGREIIIEIQNQREVDYLQRLLWGTSKVVVESLELGSSYREVVKVISISILYHTMRLDELENTDFIYYYTTEMKGVHTQKPLSLHGLLPMDIDKPAVTSKNVFPEYYLIYVEKFEDVVNADIDEWVYFFKHGSIRDDFKSPGILLAAKKLKYLKLSEQEKRAYDDYLEYLGYELGLLDTAKADGRIEGIIEGKLEGIIEGKLEGIIEGKIEGKLEGKFEGIIEGKLEGKLEGILVGKIEERKEIARNLLEMLDDETIAMKTKLSIDEVRRLRKD